MSTYPIARPVHLWESEGKFYQRVSQAQLNNLKDAAIILQPEGQKKVGFFVPAPIMEEQEDGSKSA